MGRPKAWLSFGPERMLQRVVRLIGTVAQIPRGEGRTFAVAGRRIAVFHTHSGEVL